MTSILKIYHFCLCCQEPGETALHLAVRMVDRNTLHIVDFLVQNRCENVLLGDLNFIKHDDSV